MEVETCGRESAVVLAMSTLRDDTTSSQRKMARQRGPTQNSADNKMWRGEYALLTGSVLLIRPSVRPVVSGCLRVSTQWNVVFSLYLNFTMSECDAKFQGSRPARSRLAQRGGDNAVIACSQSFCLYDKTVACIHVQVRRKDFIKWSWAAGGTYKAS